MEDDKKDTYDDYSSYSPSTMDYGSSLTSSSYTSPSYTSTYVTSDFMSPPPSMDYTSSSIDTSSSYGITSDSTTPSVVVASTVPSQDLGSSWQLPSATVVPVEESAAPVTAVVAPVVVEAPVVAAAVESPTVIKPAVVVAEPLPASPQVKLKPIDTAITVRPDPVSAKAGKQIHPEAGESTGNPAVSNENNSTNTTTIDTRDKLRNKGVINVLSNAIAEQTGWNPRTVRKVLLFIISLIFIGQILSKN